MSTIRVTFFGSSTDDYSKDIEAIFVCLFDVYDEVILINGGYQGTMKDISKIGKAIAENQKKKIYVQGILFDGYKNDPNQSGFNIPNSISDAQISSPSIGSRVQSLIELADIIIAFPGKTGTLHEIIQTVETIRYGMNYSKEEDNFKRLLIHYNWKKSIDDIYENGNMSKPIYQILLNNFFSFDIKDDKEKEQIVGKLQSIKLREDEPEKKDILFTDFSIKLLHNERETLPDDHRLTKLIGEINKELYGSYSDTGKGNKVVGLDIALRLPSPEVKKLFKLDSIGTSKYFKTLNTFLGRYKSLIENKERTNKWFQIKNIDVTETNDLFYDDHKNENTLEGNENGTIDNWVEYLEINNLGKHLYWMSIKLEPYYHISAFLALDCLLSEHVRNNVEKVLNQFLLEYMLVVSRDEYMTKITELERLKTKTMFSLTTHSLKTHLNTTVIKTKNAFRDNKLKPYPELAKAFEEHSLEVDTLFHLTELLSLIDKIEDSNKFKVAAIEVLFSETKVPYKLKEHLQKFNKRHPTSPDIKIFPEIELFDFCVRIYNLYFGEKLLELLFNTIFENILAYGRPFEGKKNLNIEINNGYWKFTNETVDNSIPFDETQVKGNLQLFKKLMSETKSGTFSISTKDHKFEIEVKAGNDEPNHDILD